MTALTLTGFEALYLGGLAGIPALVGIADPTRGLMAGEVEAALTVARSALIDRGVIRIEPDGRAAIHTFDLHGRSAGEICTDEGSGETCLRPITAAVARTRIRDLLGIAAQTPTNAPAAASKVEMLLFRLWQAES